MTNVKPFASALVGVSDLNDLTGIYDRNATTVTVTNTTQTTIYTKSIGAGVLGSTWRARCEIFGNLRTDTAETLTMRISYGATVMHSSSWSPGTAAQQPYFFTFDLYNKGSASSQGMIGRLMVGTPSGTTTGIGGTSPIASVNVLGGFASENSALAKTLTVDVQWTAVVASTQFTKDYATLELL